VRASDRWERPHSAQQVSGVPSGVIREDSDSLRCIEYGVDSVEQGRMPKEGEQGRDVEFRSEHLGNRLRVTLMQAGDKHHVLIRSRSEDRQTPRRA